MEFINNTFNDEDVYSLDKVIEENTKQKMTVIELGSYTGRSSLSILPHVHRMNGKLFCVDWFKGSPGNVTALNGSCKKENIFEIFRNNIREAGYEDNIVTLVGKTDDVVSVVADNIADILFIDADHRYSNVRNDIINWYPKIKRNGIICGHDFSKLLKDLNYMRVLSKSGEDSADGNHYGVTRAVCEFFPNVSWEGQIWNAPKDDYPVLDFALKLREIKKFQCGAENKPSFSLAAPDPGCNISSQKDSLKFQLNELKAEFLNANDDYGIASLASLLWEEGEKETAIELLKWALEVMPENLTLISLLGFFYYKLNNFQESISLFETIISISQSDEVVLNIYGEALYRVGLKEKAEEAFRNTIALSPNYFDAFNNMAVISWAKGDKESGYYYVKKAMEISEFSSVDAFINLAEMMASDGRRAEAVTLLEKYRYYTEDDRIGPVLLELSKPA